MTMQECIARCQAAHASALDAVHRSLEQGGKAAFSDNVNALLDFAKATEAAADSMLRRSAHHADMCRLTAHLAEVCKGVLADMEDPGLTKHVADIDACASSCREMAGASHI